MTDSERQEAIKIIRSECYISDLLDLDRTRMVNTALDTAIKALETPPSDDWEKYSEMLWKEAYERGKADAEQMWIPVKWHDITEEEREKEGYPSEWVVRLDCILPEDGEEILITTKRGIVEKDTAYCDDGCYLDSGYDWVDDVVAWMPLPEPYKDAENDRPTV